MSLYTHLASADHALKKNDVPACRASLGSFLRVLRQLPLLPDQVQLAIDLALALERFDDCDDQAGMAAVALQAMILAGRLAVLVQREERSRAYRNGRAALENMQAMASALQDLPIEAKEPLLHEADRLINGWYTLLEQVNPPGPHADAVYTQMRREAQR